MVFTRTFTGAEYLDVWVGALRRVCQSVKVATLFEKPLCTVEYDKTEFHLFGYVLPLNSFDVDSTLEDKKSTHTLLSRYNVPCVPAMTIPGRRAKMGPSYDYWKELLKSYDGFGRNVVVKPNRGKGGEGVYWVDGRADEEAGLTELDRVCGILRSSSLTSIITPYIHLLTEWRCVILRRGNVNELLLVIKKNPLQVTGDGVRTIGEAVVEKVLAGRADVGRLRSELEAMWNTVLPPGEVFTYWKCNQSCGAEVSRVALGDVPPPVHAIALQAANALGIAFGCVDVLESDDGSLRVLEANTHIITDLFDFLNDDELDDVIRTALQAGGQRRAGQAAEVLDGMAVDYGHLDPSCRAPAEAAAKFANRANAIRLAAVQNGLLGESLDYNWSVLVQNEAGKRTHIIQFFFGINTFPQQQLCSKCCASQLLERSGVPCIPHYPVTSCNMKDIRLAMTKYNLPLEGSLILKKDSGSGGSSVFKASSWGELDQAVEELRGHHCALSPFVPLNREFRVVILYGKCLLSFTKELTCVTGDGINTVQSLIAAQVPWFWRYSSLPEASLKEVPTAGERRRVTWKHNLQQGALIAPSDISCPIVKEAIDIAEKAMGALHLTFGAVDVCEIAGDGKPRLSVLEINSNPQFNEFIAQLGEHEAARAMSQCVKQSLKWSTLAPLSQLTA